VLVSAEDDREMRTQFRKMNATCLDLQPRGENETWNVPIRSFALSLGKM